MALSSATLKCTLDPTITFPIRPQESRPKKNLLKNLVNGDANVVGCFWKGKIQVVQKINDAHMH